MDYYIELTLLPDADMNLNHLWQKVFPQVHLALVEQKSADNQSEIGLSWPKYRYGNRVKTLGNKLRFFAIDEKALARLNLDRHLAKLMDYVHIRSIDQVPKTVSHFGCFYRLNHDASNEKLARRYASRNNISQEQALERFDGREIKVRHEPYIQMKSLNSQQTFRLFIGFESKQAPQAGYFNASYGVTPKAVQATVPIF